MAEYEVLYTSYLINELELNADILVYSYNIKNKFYKNPMDKGSHIMLYTRTKVNSQFRFCMIWTKFDVFTALRKFKLLNSGLICHSSHDGTGSEGIGEQ